MDSLLDVEDGETHVMLGDLFDLDTISNRVLLFAIEAYTVAATTNRDTDFIIMEGNHDAGHLETRTTSFDVLVSALSNLLNVIVVRNNTQYENKSIDITYFGWSRHGYSTDVTTSRVVGHWDVVDFGDNHNVVPNFPASVTTIVTGHDHVRRTVGRIEVVGSMQPYGHSQDPDKEFYVTLTLEEYLTSQEDFTNKCVRFRLHKDEVMPENVECLQRTWVPFDQIQDQEDETQVPVSLEFDFNIRTALREELSLRQASDSLIEEVLTIFSEAQISHE